MIHYCNFCLCLLFSLVFFVFVLQWIKKQIPRRARPRKSRCANVTQGCLISRLPELKRNFTNFCIYLYNFTAGYVSRCRFNLLKASPVKAINTRVVQKCPIWGHILESEKYFFSLESFGKSFHIIGLSITEDVHHRNKNRLTIKNVAAFHLSYLITSFILHVRLTKCHIKL